jgi:uncharacterized protein (DUF433 family)
MQLPEFLTEWPYGEIVLTGHRIGLYHVISYHNDGYSSEMLHEEFPSLPLELINKVLQYYAENRAEVDAYMDRCQVEIDRQRSTGSHLDLEELERKARAKGMDVDAIRQRLKEIIPERGL